MSHDSPPSGIFKSKIPRISKALLEISSLRAPNPEARSKSVILTATAVSIISVVLIFSGMCQAYVSKLAQTSLSIVNLVEHVVPSVQSSIWNLCPGPEPPPHVPLLSRLVACFHVIFSVSPIYQSSVPSLGDITFNGANSTTCQLAVAS